jgi:hypothetical protein
MDKRFVVLICSAVMLGLAWLPAAAQQKTAKQCNDEWTASKAAIQASGKTKKVFIAECRGQATAAPPAAAPARTAATPPPTPPPATTRSPTAAAPTAAGQFSTEAQAKARCPGATVVWVNLNSKVYHFAGTRNYGTTKSGAYICEKDTVSAGFRAAKNEKRP